MGLGHHRRALRTTVVGAASAALIAGSALGLAPTARAAANGVRVVDISGDGGTVLKANVVTPAGADGSRRHPLIVLPTSWGLPQVEYLAQARQLADSGYVVLTYNVRGFRQSGGETSVAGPPDMAGASRVVDWALANTPADPGHIGMAGVSYGARHQPAGRRARQTIKAPQRPRAVPEQSHKATRCCYVGHFGGENRAVNASGGSRSCSGGREGRSRTGTTCQTPRSDPGESPPQVRERTPIRPHPARERPDTVIGARHSPGPLPFLPGDHATAEITGLFGLPNDVWTDTRRWFDRYLKGADNGIDREQPVWLKSRSTGGYEGYPDWKSVGATSRKTDLGGTTTIHTNVDSGADGGVVFLSGILDQVAELPPVASIPPLPRRWAAVWQSEKHATTQRVRGTARLHTTLTPTEESGTLVAYLYDVGPLGLGKLVSNAPYTFHGRTPGKPFGVDLELFSTACDVPAGHRLALVVDTVDPLYVEHNPSGTQLTFSSPANDPSYVSIPLREQ